MSESVAKEHRTVSRVVAILEAAAAEPGKLRLHSLAALLDAPKSSIHGLVKGLIAAGYLVEEDDGTYAIGPAVGLLLGPSRPTLAAVARRAMTELHKRWNESVMLAYRVGDSVVYADMIESTQVIRYAAPLRQRRPLYPTSSGKCFLAFATPAWRQAYLAEHLADPREREAAARELDQVRREGFARNCGETIPDVYAIASPLLAGGKPLACISIAGPGSRMTDRLADIADDVRAVTAEASRALASERGTTRVP
jgi:DNA-binding IclR family transcriptional regulator